MKTIQFLSTFFFLILTIPAFLYLSTRNTPQEEEKIELQDTIREKNVKSLEATEASIYQSTSSSVDHYPIIKDCLFYGDYKSQKNCSDEKLFSLIKEHLEYPINAIEKGIEGNCVISFIVDRTGFIRDVKLIQDIGSGCGKAAVNAFRIIEDQIEFAAGKIDGISVNTKVTIPVVFQLKM